MWKIDYSWGLATVIREWMLFYKFKFWVLSYTEKSILWDFDWGNKVLCWPFHFLFTPFFVLVEKKVGMVSVNILCCLKLDSIFCTLMLSQISSVLITKLAQNKYWLVGDGKPQCHHREHETVLWQLVSEHGSDRGKLIKVHFCKLLGKLWFGSKSKFERSDWNAWGVCGCPNVEWCCQFGSSSRGNEAKFGRNEAGSQKFCCYNEQKTRIHVGGCHGSCNI